MAARPCLALAGLLAGCTLTAKTVNIGQKTALERQLMGEVEPLTEEQILAASVRAQDVRGERHLAPAGVGAGSLDDLRARALAARRRQLFNRDDLDELKQAGCLGEGLRAALSARPCEKSGEAAALVSRLVEQENADRQAIIDWALATDPVLGAADRPQIEAVYTRLLHEAAKTGEWVQSDHGSWSKR